jgi:hypothetical protein
MSTTRTSPACLAPGVTYRPIFGAWFVVVRLALIAGPSTSPVDALTPEGTSAATTGASAALIAAITPARGSRTAPSKPVPSNASTMAPQPASAAGSNGRGGAPGRRSRFVRGTPARSSSAIGAMTSTSCPASLRRRAEIRPSPPLLPGPTTTRMGLPRATSAAAAASPVPAFSASSNSRMSRRSIAKRSAARISSGL